MHPSSHTFAHAHFTCLRSCPLAQVGVRTQYEATDFFAGARCEDVDVQLCPEGGALIGANATIAFACQCNAGLTKYTAVTTVTGLIAGILSLFIVPILV